MKRALTITMSISDTEAYGTKPLSEAQVSVTAFGNSIEAVYQMLNPAAVINLPAIEEIMYSVYASAKASDPMCSNMCLIKALQSQPELD